MKICKGCNQEKEEIDFKENRNTCIICRNLQHRTYGKTYHNNYKDKVYKTQKVYREINKDNISIKAEIYYENNKGAILIKQKEYRKNNPDKIKLSRENNKEKTNKKRRISNKLNKDTRNKKRKNRYNTDIIFKLRLNISNSIRRALDKNNSSKNNKSTFKYLPYTKDELKKSLESKFEDWMNWGKYIPENWNDNDPSTWKWQIDHEKPHSLFNYTSMEDEEFKECWALDNLRPYSAKQNLLDGAKRISHNL